MRLQQSSAITAGQRLGPSVQSSSAGVSHPQERAVGPAGPRPGIPDLRAQGPAHSPLGRGEGQGPRVPGGEGWPGQLGKPPEPPGAGLALHPDAEFGIEKEIQAFVSETGGVCSWCQRRAATSDLRVLPFSLPPPRYGRAVPTLCLCIPRSALIFVIFLS